MRKNNKEDAAISKLYIVEDDEAVRDSLVAVFAALGYAVRAFATGMGFLDGVDSSRRGCLILDIHLPVMDGFELIENMAARRLEMPVIVVSGQIEKDGMARLLERGVTAVLRKPLDTDLLIESVRKALGG